jgi:hypothetical protein
MRSLSCIAKSTASEAIPPSGWLSSPERAGHFVPVLTSTLELAPGYADAGVAAMDQARTIIRDRRVPVGGGDQFLPKQVVEQVSARIDRDFSMHMHTQAWRYFRVRPPSDASDQYKTRSEFCFMNELVGKHIYTPAWVHFLVRKLSDPVIYDEIAAVK